MTGIYKLKKKKNLYKILLDSEMEQRILKSY